MAADVPVALLLTSKGTFKPLFLIDTFKDKEGTEIQVLSKEPDADFETLAMALQDFEGAECKL